MDAGRAGATHGDQGAGGVVRAAGRGRARRALAAKRRVAGQHGRAGGRVASRCRQQRPGGRAPGTGHGPDAGPPVPGAGGGRHKRGDSPDGFDPNDVRLVSKTGEDPGDIEGEKPPGHEHTHHGVHVPEIVPGLHGPDTSSNIPHLPIPLLGSGRSPASAGAGGGRPTLVGPSTESLASESGILRSVAQGKGNFGIGQATEAAADRLGRAWVGSNPILASDGRTLISQDGLRQYRPPSFKPNLGKMQANFEQRLVSQGQWQSNGHLNIVK